MGEHDLSQEIDCFNDDETDTPEMCAEKFQELEIEEIIVHPEAKEGVSANDIALIRMKEAANFNKNVQPVCLPFSSELRKSKIREIISLGWGATEEKWYSDVLLDATMPYVTIERCRKMYEGKALVLSEERQFCAGAVVSSFNY